VARFDFPLHDAAGRFLQKLLTVTPCCFMQRKDLTPGCKNAAARFDSHLHNAAERFDSPLHQIQFK
jgi:hypothetical protein